MITDYPYVGIMITGCLQFFLGITVFIIAVLYFTPYTLMTSLWILVVGIVGLEAAARRVNVDKMQQLIFMTEDLDIKVGLQKIANEKIRILTLSYMLASIMSACVFGGLVTWLYTGVKIVPSHTTDTDYYFAIRSIVIASLEVILAFVSFLICCCCSPTTSNTAVSVKAPPQEIVNNISDQITIQYKSPLNTKMEYHLPPNTTMQYEPSGYETVSSQPPPYQQYADPTKPH